MQKRSILLLVLLTFFYATIYNPAFAAFTIPAKPIFLANDVPANIFFALDDSGSMDAEILKSTAARESLNNLIGTGGGFFSSVLFGGELRDLDLTPDQISEDWEQCAQYNVMAYDPTQTYTPWNGSDNSGSPFTDQVISSARKDPFNASAGTTNLLNIDGSGRPAWYSIFSDNSQCRTDLSWPSVFNSNSAARLNDGKFQVCECLSANTVSSGNAQYRSRFDLIAGTGDSRFFRVDTLSPTEQKNYANWYTYYRNRDHVMKKAVGQLISSSTQRMGLATLQNNAGVGTPVRDMTTFENKSSLLNSLYKISPSGLTPLRRTLRNVGRYFDNTDTGSHNSLGFSDSSPILSSSEGGGCQQNFAILFSDGFWNGASPSDIINEDGDNNSSFDGGPHGDSVSSTLADVAMKYYEKDLDNSLPDDVPVIPGVDDNTAQHLVTYTVSYGLDGTLSSVPENHDSSTPPPPWPIPFANQLTTVDDMRHAAFNARGLYLPGQNPQQLIDTLSAALADIGSRTGAASAAASTSQSLRTDSLIFQGTFNSEDWSGTLSAFPIDSSGIIGTSQWEASSLIPPENSRKIFSFDSNPSTKSGIEFQFINLSANQKTALGSDAENLVNYIRGDQSQEILSGGSFRDRASLLGDIIHSTPVAVTKTQANPPFERLPGLEGSSYNAHLVSKSTMTDAVFVGANDGHLHAFNASTGVEIMSYVPEAIFSELSILTSPAYDHNFFVDGILNAGDVFINSSWKTILVGSLGRGGNTIFALDVSNVDSFSASNVLWEFSDPDMGNFLGKPQLVRLNNGKWAVIAGNGYNSTNERPELFIIDAETGTLIRKITAGDGTDENNGLSTALAVDINSDLITDFIYTGDLKGNLWKFDLSASNSASWNVAFSNTPLYTALAPDGNVQPIMSKPVIAAHPNGGFLILFGTGKFFAQGDEIIPSSDVSIDSFYGIRDNGSPVGSVGARSLPSAGAQPSNILQPQAITTERDETKDSVTTKIRITTDNKVDYDGSSSSSTQHGWYLDLISPVDGTQGERVIADPQLRNTQDTTVVLFNTFVPGGSCQSIGGFSTLMTLDALNGSRTPFSIFDLNGDNRIDNSDKDSVTGLAANGRIGKQSVSAVTVISGSDGTENFVIQSSTQAITPTVDRVAGSATSLGRQSWRQIQ